MKREIIDSLIINKNGGKLIALQLNNGKFAVRYMPHYLDFSYDARGFQEQFYGDKIRRHDLFGVAYVTWHAVSDREKAAEIKKFIRRKMAKYWIKQRRRNWITSLLNQ